MTGMLAESHDEEQIIARVAALDIGKAELVCCVRVPAPAGGRRRLQEVSTHSTMTKSLADLANRLVGMGVERVVMEATSSYWKPVSTYWKRTGWIRGWSMHAMSSIYPVDRKPMCWTRCGCARWPSGRC